VRRPAWGPGLSRGRIAAVMVAVVVAAALGIGLALEGGTRSYPTLRVKVGRHTLSVATGGCAAPDTPGWITGAANCMRRTSAIDPLPASYVAARQGQALRITSSGSFDYVLLRVDRPPCGRAVRVRLAAARPVWIVPRHGPATYTIRIVFSRSHGITPTAVFGVRAGVPPPSRAHACAV
jgi:hypothetical protein